MSDMTNSRINEESLKTVTGGTEVEPVTYTVRPIKKTRIRVTASTLHCRYAPDGLIACDFTYGTILYVEGITSDGLWYRLLIEDPKTGGVCYGFIYKEYTELAE